MLKLNVKDEHGCHSHDLFTYIFYFREDCDDTLVKLENTNLLPQLQLHNSTACKHDDAQKMRL